MGCGASAADHAGGGHEKNRTRHKKRELVALELTDFGEDIAEKDMMLPAEHGGDACTAIELQLLKEHGIDTVKQRRAISEFLVGMKKEHVPESLVFASWEMWNARKEGGKIVYATPPTSEEVPGLNAKTFSELVGGVSHAGFWVRKLFQCCDVNADGSLSLLEFLRFLPKIVNVPRNDSAALVFFFNLLDSDKSGFVTEMDLSTLQAESKATANRDSRDSFGLAGVQTDKPHRRRSLGAPVTLLEYAQSLPGHKISFPQLCDFWKRVPSCIFDSRAVCESILKRLHDHAKDRMRSQAQQHLLTKSWSICNPATASSLYKQLTLDTFKYASDTSVSAALTPSAVTLAGEAFLKDRQSKFKDLRVRGNRLLIYNQIIQPPKGITVEDTQVARLAFKMTDADENSMMDENEMMMLWDQGDVFASEQDKWVKQGLFRFMNTEQLSHVGLGVFTKFMCGAWLASKTLMWHLAFHIYDYMEQGFLDATCIRHILRLSNEVAESNRRYSINVRSKVIAVYLRDNAPGSCSGDSPEDNLRINEVHWLVAVEKFPELLTPITVLLKQPQLAVEEVRRKRDGSHAPLLQRLRFTSLLPFICLTPALQAGMMKGDKLHSAHRAQMYMDARNK